MATKNYYAIANTIKIDHPRLEWISGKWFDNGIEIKDIKKWLVRNYARYTQNPSQTQTIIDSFIEIWGDHEAFWPPIPIIKEAQDSMEKMGPMVFPLNKKQLEIIRVLLEHKEEAFFIVTGVGGSGKSTFGNIVKQIFENDVAYLDLGEISNSFTAVQMVDKRLVYSEELNAEKLNNGKIKTFVSNQVCSWNPKGQKPFDARCQSGFLFCCNTPPFIDLEDTGILRRIIYYSMDQKIENPDKTLAKRAWTHEDLVNIVRHSLSIDIEDWRSDFEEETHLNLLRNNSVYRLRQTNSYGDYKDSCYMKGYKPYSESSWMAIRALMEEWGIESKT